MIVFTYKDFLLLLQTNLKKKRLEEKKFGEKKVGSKKINEKAKGPCSHQLEIPRKYSGQEACYHITVKAPIMNEF